HRRRLHQGTEPEAAGHYRISLEVAGEEPKVRFEVELRPYQALAVFAALLRDFRDAVEHEHGRQRQLRAVVEEFTAAAGQQVLVVEACAPVVHPYPVLRCRAGSPRPSRTVLTYASPPVY